MLIQIEIDNLNRYLLKNIYPLKKLKPTINNLPKQKVTGPDDLINKVYQSLKEEMILILYSFFQKTEAEEHFLIHSMKAALLYYQNQTKTSQERKMTDNITHELQNPQVNSSKSNLTMYKKNYIP